MLVARLERLFDDQLPSYRSGEMEDRVGPPYEVVDEVGVSANGQNDGLSISLPRTNSNDVVAHFDRVGGRKSSNCLLNGADARVTPLTKRMRIVDEYHVVAHGMPDQSLYFCSYWCFVSSAGSGRSRVMCIKPEKSRFFYRAQDLWQQIGAVTLQNPDVVPAAESRLRFLSQVRVEFDRNDPVKIVFCRVYRLAKRGARFYKCP